MVLLAFRAAVPRWSFGAASPGAPALGRLATVRVVGAGSKAPFSPSPAPNLPAQSMPPEKPDGVSAETLAAADAVSGPERPQEETA